MRMPGVLLSCFLLLRLGTSACQAGVGVGNRLVHLDESSPYHVGLDSPRLTTPQWVGEDGVEAVVVLAIDDLKENAPHYETYLRPILNRLKQIDGRAGLSIMTCKVDPADPQVKAWLAEGVNLDVHTLDHPCPLMKDDEFDQAEATVHDCVDLLHQIKGNRPVAFRMPCCDSLNTPTPRFYAEIFNKRSSKGHFMTLDSSVFQLFTPADPALPRELVTDPDGRERFRKYIPFSYFTNYVENYPYPYVIGKLCWEFPCCVPSDWEAQNLRRPNHEGSVEDMKAAIDAVVLKQGVYNLVFHPHGWIKSEQVVSLIDHVAAKYGSKVKFLNFSEAQSRLDQHLLNGHPLRNSHGKDNGVRLLDVNNDGYMDVVISNHRSRQTRVWDPKGRRWLVSRFPVALIEQADENQEVTPRHGAFGVLDPEGQAGFLARAHGDHPARFYQFVGGGIPESKGDEKSLPEGWVADPALSLGLETVLKGKASSLGERIHLRDLDGDGQSELIVSRPKESTLLQYGKAGWKTLPFALPEGARLTDAEGRDGGLRFVDVDEDGYDDILFSRPADSDEMGQDARAGDRGTRSGLALFDTMKNGWARGSKVGQAEEGVTLPLIVDRGRDQGMWVHSRQLWWRNESTSKQPHLVDHRSFNDLLNGVEPRGRSAEASRRAMRVDPAFNIELVASEPLVEDPIAFDWSADGRLWVLEMGDYPRGADGRGKAGGVIRILDDQNGDGRYDRSTTFLDDLNYPSGLMPWRNGVLIACAPDVLYAEDRDGDGRADHREVLFTGFREGNQQHRLNGFELGLDGWVYGANGDSGGVVRSLKTGSVVKIQGRDFRFDPDDGRFEAESGQTQYGRHRDDWGNWFGNNNPNWAWHYVLADSDLRRNPGFAAPDPRRMLEPDPTVYPISATLARFNEPHSANRVTSANSPTPYRDDLFGPHFQGSLFVSEPVHNLIHRVIVEPDGATYIGRRGPDESKREFLASSDHWTRPTMLRTGPDGALWVADMYRAVIEHPEWIPDDWEAKLDLRAGASQGRIYRIHPVDRRPRAMPKLDQLEPQALVVALDSPNGWQRDTVQRLLLHKQAKNVAPELARLARESSRPQVRLQALWVLQTLGELKPEQVIKALSDPHPQVRRNAARAGTERLKTSRELGEALLRLVDDPDVQVRLQVALSLGDWNDPRSGQALARLLSRDATDPWIRAAVLSSATSRASEILAHLLENSSERAIPSNVLDPLFALAARDQQGREKLLEKLKHPAGPAKRFANWQLTATASLLEAQAKIDRSRIGRLLETIGPTLSFARTLVVDSEASVNDRVAAIRLLGMDPNGEEADRDALAALLRPRVASAIQQAALSSLGRGQDPLVPSLLIAGWKGHSPQLRSAILDTVLSRTAWTRALLDALEEGIRISPSEIDPTHRLRLLGHQDRQIKARAQEIYAREPIGTRHQVVADYQRSTADREGHAETGAQVFKKNCATCHRIGTEGVEVGPDLASLKDKSPQSLLIAILDPNRALEVKYGSFNVATTDGRVLSGLISTETSTAITLKRQEGKEDVLLRSEIEELSASGQSLMPEGLEKELTPQDLADLIAFLRAAGPGPRVVAGNHPERVEPGPDGTIHLSAINAEIHGEILTYEPEHQNLGYWSRLEDRVTWQFRVERPGRYRVRMNWACADASAGNALVLEAGSKQLTYRVKGTGTWENYRFIDLGTLDLQAGAQSIELHSVGPIKGALLDLRSIRLVPEAAEGGANPPEPDSTCCGNR